MTLVPKEMRCEKVSTVQASRGKWSNHAASFGDGIVKIE